MSRYVFKMPDLGEGTVSAEVVEWKVKVGDSVQEDQVIAEVMTDKAAVEIPSPVTGRVVSITGQPGDMVAVGAELIAFDTSGAAPAEPAAATKPAAGPASAPPAKPAAAAAVAPRKSNGPAAQAAPAPAVATRVMASPATRRKAHVAGVDLATVPGSGPGGRISAQDLEAVISGHGGAAARPAIAARKGVEEIKVIGLRRLIAERMSAAKRNIPHFSYVEEVDVTELEALRQYLNSRQPKGTPSLTYLPFLVAALVRVLEKFPQCNAVHDAERNVILRHSAVHVGVATQSPDGLKVPVVKHAEARSLHDLAAEIRRVSEAARSNKATRDELTGSTITVTSLGKLGGIASTPVINAPEVAIVGVNKAVERPVVVDGSIAIRRIMNLSSSFDHRFVDGFDAAAMIQALKEKLEHPATIFIQD
ncbi:MAG TPA: dihydrolipoamide acetyltransferase family protein [Steroidobacteraceae bacterium]|nr:dihydrolipoamide acetyltransferase family protein [Steroidobacteraceae bacterium]